MTNNKYIIATVNLYHRREEKLFECLFSLTSSNRTSFKEYEKSCSEANRAWFFGLNRWGREFADCEYEIRENEAGL